MLWSVTLRLHICVSQVLESECLARFTGLILMGKKRHFVFYEGPLMKLQQSLYLL